MHLDRLRNGYYRKAKRRYKEKRIPKRRVDESVRGKILNIYITIEC